MKRASSEKVLLDVNVLLALAWPNHQYHATATNRLDASSERWATCALTQLGFIRPSTNPTSSDRASLPRKRPHCWPRCCPTRMHLFIEAMPSPVTPPHVQDFDRVLGAKQLTDLYLLRVAANASARFLTFDSRLEELARDMCQVEVLGRFH